MFVHPIYKIFDLGLELHPCLPFQGFHFVQLTQIFSEMTCSNFLDVCTLKLYMNMLLLFMICGHTSLLLFILSYDDDEYKTTKVSKSN